MKSKHSKHSESTNRTIQELYNRKSIRVYEDRPIEPEKREAILEAALQAPTAGNMTLYSIIDVTDQKKKDALAITCDNQPFIAKAPLVLVFCADYRKWYDVFSQYEETVRKPGMGDLFLAFSDALIAAQNSVVAAESMGIGSCYIGDILERYETHRELFRLPKYVAPAAMAVYGYPAGKQAERVKPARIPKRAVVFENDYRPMEETEYASCLSERQGRTEEDFTRWIKAFCKRKWNSDFSAEMSRSAEAMVKDWLEDEDI